MEDEEYKESEISKKVKELMDDGYEFGEAVREALKQGFADGGSIGIEVLFKPKRQNLFMGGPALTGPALGIYNSMKAYQSFTDQEIADAIKQAGYDLPTADSGTNAPPDSTPSNNQSGGNEGQGGIMNLDPYKNAASSGNQSNNFLNKTVSTIGDFAGSMMDKFSGTNVGEGITSAATKFKNIAITPMMALMQKRNPLNPSASNYNPSLQGQMDMLGGMTGTKISGTYIDPYNTQLGFTDNLTGQAMIGRDPNSGLAKYGPGSVLAGQNVVSGFGTNDYEDQLQGYIDKMIDRRTKGVLTEFQEKKLEAAYAVLERAKTQAIEDAAKKKREMDAKIAAAEKSAMERVREQQAIDEAAYRNQPGQYGGDNRQQEREQAGPGYSGSGTAAEMGSFARGGRVEYKDGGLATMFTRKR